MAKALDEKNRLWAQGVISGNAGCLGKKKTGWLFYSRAKKRMEIWMPYVRLGPGLKSIKYISSGVNVEKILVQVSQISVASIEAFRKICSN